MHVREVRALCDLVAKVFIDQEIIYALSTSKLQQDTKNRYVHFLVKVGILISIHVLVLITYTSAY